MAVEEREAARPGLPTSPSLRASAPGSKCRIDAGTGFRHVEDFAPRTGLSKPVHDEVARTWNELGFEGEAPKVGIFEDAKGTTAA